MSKLFQCFKRPKKLEVGTVIVKTLYINPVFRDRNSITPPMEETKSEILIITKMKTSSISGQNTQPITVNLSEAARSDPATPSPAIAIRRFTFTQRNSQLKSIEK